jgi:putative ABC transport system substrate-binding protein
VSRGGGLVVLPSNFMLTHRDLVIALAARHRLPAVYAFRHYAESGGLMSYGSVVADEYYQAAMESRFDVPGTSTRN